MHYSTATLERTARTFRADMWQTVCEDAVDECGIEELCCGPVQATVFQALPHIPKLNVILGAAEPEAVEQGHLARAVEWSEEFGVDFRVQVSRGRPGMELAEEWLNWRGFEQGTGIQKYIRDCSPPNFAGSREITVWEIGEEESDGEVMALTAAEALGLPQPAGALFYSLPVQDHWRTFTAEIDGLIASFGSMLINDGVARIGLDATIKEARGRGGNRELLRERILVAGESGCHTIVAELDEDGSKNSEIAARNLLRAGFIPAYRSLNWQLPRC